MAGMFFLHSQQIRKQWDCTKYPSALIFMFFVVLVHKGFRKNQENKVIQDSGSTTLHCIGVKWSSMSLQLVLSKLISVGLLAGGERKVSILQCVVVVFSWCVTIATVMPGWKPRSWWYRALYTVIIYHLAGCMQRTTVAPVLYLHASPIQTPINFHQKSVDLHMFNFPVSFLHYVWTNEASLGVQLLNLIQ